MVLFHLLTRVDYVELFLQLLVLQVELIHNDLLIESIALVTSDQRLQSLLRLLLPRSGIQLLLLLLILL